MRPLGIFFEWLTYLVCIADGNQGAKLSSVQRKKLADISNLQRQFKPRNQDVKQKSTTVTTKEYVEKLHKVYIYVTLSLLSLLLIISMVVN